MQIKALLGLGLVTVGAAALATMTLRNRDAQAGPELGLLFEGLDARINDVAKLEIKKEGEALVFERSEADPNQWKVATIGGYPAKFEPVKRAIVRLANMEIREQKTKKPAYYEKLGVTEPGAEGSSSRLVTLSDASGNELASVILGETSYKGSSSTTYARRTGEEWVYVCDGRVDAEPTLRTWIDTVALKLENDRVQSVNIAHADGEQVQLDRSPENHTQFVVANVPAGRELKYEGIANNVATALSSVSFDDVRPAAEVDFTQEPLAQSRFTCHDGLVVVIETARFEDKTWARIRTSYEAPPAKAEEEPAATDQTAGEGDEGSDEAAPDEPTDEHGHELAEAEAGDTPDPEAVRAEAEELSTRHAAWAYALPSYKADVIARRMADLLNELPEEGEETAAAPEGPEGDDAMPPELQEALKALGNEGVPTDDGDG